MEIHKPKPWRGLREFFKEYLIIVVGVLTALAAEQAVEALHHQAQAREMAEKWRAESQENRHVIVYDVESLKTGLASTDTLLAGLASGAPTLPALQRPDTFRPADTAWITIRDSALLPIMPKLLVDNGWKVEATNEYVDSLLHEVGEGVDSAEAALVARQASPGDADLGRTVRLRLADLRVKEAKLIRGLAELQDINDCVLRGERLDAPGDAQKARARGAANLPSGRRKANLA